MFISQNDQDNAIDQDISIYLNYNLNIADFWVCMLEKRRYWVCTINTGVYNTKANNYSFVGISSIVELQPGGDTNLNISYNVLIFDEPRKENSDNKDQLDIVNMRNQAEVFKTQCVAEYTYIFQAAFLDEGAFNNEALKKLDLNPIQMFKRTFPYVKKSKEEDESIEEGERRRWRQYLEIHMLQLMQVRRCLLPTMELIALAFNYIGNIKQMPIIKEHINKTMNVFEPSMVESYDMNKVDECVEIMALIGHMPAVKNKFEQRASEIQWKNLMSLELSNEIGMVEARNGMIQLMETCLLKKDHGDRQQWVYFYLSESSESSKEDFYVNYKKRKTDGESQSGVDNFMKMYPSEFLALVKIGGTLQEMPICFKCADPHNFKEEHSRLYPGSPNFLSKCPVFPLFQSILEIDREQVYPPRPKL